MKLKFVFAGIALCLFGLMACEKEKSFETGSTPTGDTTGNNNGGGNNVTGDMRAKIDGVQWVADKATSATRVAGLLNIGGLSIDNKLIEITVVDSGVHNYTLSYDANFNYGAFTDSALADNTVFTTVDGSSAAESGGTLNITSIDEVNKKISGTFSFIVKRETDGSTRNITEGSFTNLSYGTTVSGGNATDTFRVKIDGIDLNPTLISGIDVFGNLNISGTAPSLYPNVGISIPSGTAAGTYSFEDISGSYIGQYNISSANYLVATSGTLQILEHNTTTKRIRGNFNFDASQLPPGTATAKLTEGYFAITYQ